MGKAKSCKQVAKQEVKGHEKRMHKNAYATGGIVRGAGAAQRGKRFTRAG